MKKEIACVSPSLFATVFVLYLWIAKVLPATDRLIRSSEGISLLLLFASVAIMFLSMSLMFSLFLSKLFLER
jgi:hypothetical protein